MWFKQAYVFEFDTPFTYDQETLNAHLNAQLIAECPSTAEYNFGWVSPYDRGHPLLAHTSGPYHLICLAKQERLLPASIVRDHVDQKIQEIEASQSRRVYGKEKILLRDEVTLTLLPQAFVKQRKIWAYIDTKRNRLVVDTSSQNRADEFAEIFRETFEDIGLFLPEFQKDFMSELTSWMLDSPTIEGLTIAQDCVLEDREKTIGNVRVSGQDLSAQDIIALLKTHRQVERLGLSYQDRVEFQLNKTGLISRLRFTDIVKEENADVAIDSRAAQLDADFTLMAYEISQLIDVLFEHFKQA